MQREYRSKIHKVPYVIFGVIAMLAAVLALFSTPYTLYDNPHNTPSGTSTPSVQASRAPAPAPTRQGAAAQQVLDQCLKGRLAFRPPSPIPQGETVEFVVRVALKGSPADPSEGLPGRGDVSTRGPRICETMRANLTSTGITVTRSTGESGTISIPAEGIGEWGWHLTALKPGRHDIVLRLFALGPDGTDIPVETYRETITVDVGVWYVINGWIKEYAAVVISLLTLISTWLGYKVYKKYKGKHVASQNFPT